MSLNNSIDSGLEQSKYSDLVAFTSTFYKDDVEWKVRSEACFAMLDNAQKLWIRVVIGDGGSGSEFLKRLETYPNVTLFHSGKWWENRDLTMAWERRFTGKKAMEQFPDVKHFLWLEPEKAELMKMENIDAILSPLRDGSADMVVPSRKSKDTLPPQQRDAENRANKRASDIMTYNKMRAVSQFTNREYGEDAQKVFPSDPMGLMQHYFHYSDNAQYDLWFGPKAFTRKSMTEDFLSYKWAKWDGIITSVLAWKQAWKNVVDVPVDFIYPPDQTQLESDVAQSGIYQKKRRSQYRYIIKTIKELVAKI